MNFDIIEYAKGLTAYHFDDSVYSRILLERGLSDITDFMSLTEKDKDLVTADILFVAYSAPTTTASISQKHNGFSQTYGAQTIGAREKLYNIIYALYNKHGDAKLSFLEESYYNVQFINENQ